ncbi:MAG: hypothetical protein V4602_15135 [Pseudomonadota bacterium]
MSEQVAVAGIALLIFVGFFVLFVLPVIWAERDSIRRHPGEDSEHGRVEL